MAFALYTDSFSNLPGAYLRELNMHVIPCTYLFEGKTVHYDGNIDTFDAKAYYDDMRAGRFISTSLVSPHVFDSHFRKALEAGQDIVYVGLSSGVSGTFQSAVLAAADLQAEFPDRTIRLVDSLGAGLGTGLLACRGADLRDAGLDANAAADCLAQDRMRLCEFFTVENLSYLHRTGRISAATAAIGKVLNIKPLLYGNETGHIVSCAKCRGRQKAIDAIVEKYQTKVADTKRVAISHGDCPEEAHALAERICAIAKPKELLLLPHEPFTGSHVGPGMLALFFFGDSRK